MQYKNITGILSNAMKNIYVKSTNKKGRGVFAKRNLPKGTIIEIAPVIVLPKTDSVWEHNESILDNYYYAWKVNGKDACALALGYGSLYNHSYNPNAQYNQDYKNERLKIVAIKDIEEDQEITVNYNGDPKDKSKVWFDVK